MPQAEPVHVAHVASSLLFNHAKELSLIGFLTFSSTKVKMQFLGPFQGFIFLRGASGQL